ncbi:MAG TPA: hypothetical protein VLG37_02055 [Candidatus Saccharimonadales bacterium]|nr:hypothetical protein [Candidatus Saccharimonadales bacterium]
MVFVDHSGKRWRRIKRLSLASLAVVLLPIAVLLAGAYLLKPDWQTLNTSGQNAEAQNGLVAKADQPNTKQGTNQNTALKPAASSGPKVATATSASTNTSSSLDTQATAAQPTPPALAPGNSGYGHSRKAML